MWTPTPPPFRQHKKKVYLQIVATSPFVYQVGESPLLRQSSSEVSLVDIKTKDTQAKIAYLKKSMRRFRKLTGFGRGLTGVQVGIPERMSVIYRPEIHGELIIIINPVITRKSKEKYIYPEICLSMNPLIAPVVRPAWIEFKYYDETGNKQFWNTKADDQLGKIYNRVFQHEIDHMDGIVNIDLVESKDIIFESDPDFYKQAKFESV